MLKPLALAAALLTLGTLGTAARAQTTLSQGDFAFTGLNVNTTLGGWSFVSFVDLAPGTTIYFTDTNVLRTTPAAGVFSTTAETFWSWTASEAVPAGTSVATRGNGSTSGFTASTGSVNTLNSVATNISASGDVLYAFQAASFQTNYQPADISFLGAVSNRAAWGAPASAYANSDDPFAATGLSGLQVLQFKQGTNSTRYLQFTQQAMQTDTPAKTLDTLRDELAVFGNFTVVTASSTLPLHGGVILAAVPEPGTYALMLAGLGVVGLLAGRRGQRA
jgi:hypothetical protein